MVRPQNILLFVTADERKLRTAEEAVERARWTLNPCASAADLSKIERPSVVLVDHALDAHSTFDRVRELREAWPEVPIVLVSETPSPITAIEAVRAGATDYLIAPLDTYGLVRMMQAASSGDVFERGLEPLRESLAVPIEFEAMVGTAPLFRMALAKAATAARGHSNVFVEGERGTGRKMVLRAVHASSPRAKAPLHKISVAGLRRSEAESRLFGHEQGAFPGAFESRTGLIQQCDGGALLIEGVDELEPETQQLLAQTIADGIVRPAGAQHGYRVDVRYLVTSNPSAETIGGGSEIIPELAVHFPAPIVIPPLRDRAGDIPALTRHFLCRVGEQPGVSHHSIADSGLNLLEAYDWPGNVRQLESVLFRAAIASTDEALTAASFPQLSALLGKMADRAESRQRGLGIMLYTSDGNLRALEEIEADVIRLAIGHYRGRMTEVARRLGIGRSTLYRKLADLGIDNAA